MTASCFSFETRPQRQTAIEQETPAVWRGDWGHHGNSIQRAGQCHVL